MLIDKIDNDTFMEATLPVWIGPSFTTIWIQTLAYMSLSTSLLAAFGAVLAKQQWLGHFKTSRFGRGALNERCQRRQQKLDGLEAWDFSTIIATLPIFLHLSLLFFGIALAANIWTLQHTVAGVIMAGDNGIWSLFLHRGCVVEVAGLSIPDTHINRASECLPTHSPFRKKVQAKWDEYPKSWTDIMYCLRRSSRCALYRVNLMIFTLIARVLLYFSRFSVALRHVPSLTHDLETAGVSEQSGSAGNGQAGTEPTGDQTIFFEELDLNYLELRAESGQGNALQSSAIQWILEASTDTDIITTRVSGQPRMM
jgi:Family of unknown function (DUF6535)